MNDTPNRSLWLTVLALLLLVGPESIQAESKTPKVRVSNIRRLPHNGEHNAFTDLCKFKDRYYLAYRTCPDGHMVHPTSSIMVLTSKDLQKWEKAVQFHVPLRDTRDPHFLIFANKLFVYTGTWYCGETSPESYDMNQQLGYAICSEDGKQWGTPTLLEGTYGHYIWKAATYDGKAYLCGRRKSGFMEDNGKRSRQATESAMLVSDDGLVWKTHSLFQEEWGDETAFLFEDNGDVLAVARRSSHPAEICSAKSPYKTWSRQLLDRYIGGPLLTKWDGNYLVGGRKSISGQGPVTALYWLVDGDLIEFAELPSGGDNSYPGFLELTRQTGIVSWYSSHEKDENGKPITAIYLADLEMIR